MLNEREHPQAYNIIITVQHGIKAATGIHTCEWDGLHTLKQIIPIHYYYRNGQ
jgi:hypothetical protein